MKREMKLMFVAIAFVFIATQVYVLVTLHQHHDVAARRPPHHDNNQLHNSEQLLRNQFLQQKQSSSVTSKNQQLQMLQHRIKQKPGKDDGARHGQSNEKKKAASQNAQNAQVFGGCLMIADDNHFLVEWLAYNYFMLPLRHLVVLVDDTSTTSPLEIFERWKNRITIQVVNWTYPSDLLAPVPNDLLNNTGVRHYLGKQHSFYQDCIMHYKLRLEWKSWIVAVDTDEFLAINKFTRLPNHPFYVGRSHIQKLPQNSQSGSIMKRIQQLTNDDNKNGGGTESEAEQVGSFRDCIITPRTQVCLKTVNQTKEPQYIRDLGMHSSDFLTQYWVLGDKRKNGKGMLNVGAIPIEYFHSPQFDLLNYGSAHVLTPNRTCPQLLHFQIYHYAGNLEQRTFRDSIDPRGGYANRLGGSINLADESECQMRKVHDIKPWLQGFINDVGINEARRLLKDSGKVHNIWPPYEKKKKKNAKKK